MDIKFSASSLGNHPAPLGKRIIAFVIDLAIFYLLVYSTVSSLFFYRTGIRNIDLSVLGNSRIMRILEFGFYLNTLFFLVYFSGFEFLFGQTPGKRIMKISVAGSDTFFRSVLRNMYLLFPLFILIDLFPLVYSDQRLLEKASNTQVLYQPKFVIQMEDDL